MLDIYVVHPDGHTSDELIPGARDPSTLTHRLPGSMGGDPYGLDIPAVPPDWEDDTTRCEHEREGGATIRCERGK